MFIQIDNENRVVGVMEKFFKRFNGKEEELVEQDTTGFFEVDCGMDIFNEQPFDNFIYVDGDFVHSERDIHIEQREANEAFEEREEMLNELPTTLSDIQDGLIEVAEMTADNEVSMSDVQDALVELADMVSSLLED